MMTISIGCIVGVLLGFIMPTIPYTVSKYLAIAIVAALDSVFGGIASNIKKNFDMKVFISGFFVNAILAILLTYLGERLNVDIYLAAIVVFVGRMFNNLGIIRRYYLGKISEKRKNKKENND
jgi:small basic protein